MAEIIRKLDALGKQIEEHQADDERRFDHIDETLKDVRESQETMDGRFYVHDRTLFGGSTDDGEPVIGMYEKFRDIARDAEAAEVSREAIRTSLNGTSIELAGVKAAQIAASTSLRVHRTAIDARLDSVDVRLSGIERIGERIKQIAEKFLTYFIRFVAGTLALGAGHLLFLWGAVLWGWLVRNLVWINAAASAGATVTKGVHH